MAEDLTTIRGNYKQFINSPGGIHFRKHLAELEKGLLYKAQAATDPLQAMSLVQKSASIKEILTHVDGLSH